MHSLSCPFFSSTLVARSLLSCSRGEGMDGGMGWWLKKIGHVDKSSVSPLRCKDRDSCDYHIPVINLSLSPSDPTLLLTVFTHGLTDSIMHIQWSTYRLFKAYHACVHLKRQFSQELKTRYGLLTFVSFQIHKSSRGDVLMNVHAALFHLMKVGDGDLCWKISKNTYHKITFNYGCKI